jgi:hypothetical protein
VFSFGKVPRRSSRKKSSSQRDTCDNTHSALPWAWLAAMENSGNSSDQNKATDSNVEALDKVLARFGR